MNKLTLDDLAARFDPEYVIQEPSIVYARELPKDFHTLIITSAQNATPVHPAFWATLKTIARIRDAHILVGATRYKNPTSQWSGSQRNAEHWAKEIRDYLWNQEFAINSNLTFLGGHRIVPTASNPISGVEGSADGSSLIIAHPRVQTKSVATPSGRMAKMIWTTGTCTVENYTDSRVGRLGNDHHSLSALLVEKRDNKFWIRRLHWDEVAQSVIDLDKEYDPTGSQDAPPALGVVMGDTHVDFIDPFVYGATFGPGGLVPRVRPRHLVYHDLLDAYSINPHHRGNPFIAKAKADSGMDDARAETQRAIDFVRFNTQPKCLNVVVSSNHDDMLTRWIKTDDWKTDPKNAEFYLETALAMVRSTRMTPNGTHHVSGFAHWLKQENLPDLCILGGGESFVVGEYELGFHGDKGPNGARGSIKNMSRLGNRVIIGHSHSPGELEGALQIGTSSRLLLEYNAASPSSWLNAHAVILANSFTQLIVIIDGEYHA
jgi:hypothetical protein